MPTSGRRSRVHDVISVMCSDIRAVMVLERDLTILAEHSMVVGTTSQEWASVENGVQTIMVA